MCSSRASSRGSTSRRASSWTLPGTRCAEMEEDNKLVEERREKLKGLRAKGVAFPNDFRKKDAAAELHRSFGEKPKEELEKQKAPAVVAGRMMLKRVMGKASFATLQDGSGRIQAYITQETPGYDEF